VVGRYHNRKPMISMCMTTRIIKSDIDDDIELLDPWRLTRGIKDSSLWRPWFTFSTL